MSPRRVLGRFCVRGACWVHAFCDPSVLDAYLPADPPKVCPVCWLVIPPSGECGCGV